MGVGHPADLNDGSHTLVVRFVAQVGDAADPPLAHLASDALQHGGLLHRVGQFGDDDVHLAPTDVFHIHPRLGDDALSAGVVGGADGIQLVTRTIIPVAINHPAGGKVGAGDDLH